MDSSDFYMFGDAVDASGVVFYYAGEVTNPIISAVGEVMRERMEAAEADSSARRKMFAAFIELAQNMLHYARAPDGDGTEKVFGRIAVGQADGRHYVICSNRMDARDVPRVRAKLEALNAMTPEQVKTEYRRRLRDDETEEGSAGAGLGFLTLAKITSEPIDFDFLPDPLAPEETVHFFLKAII
jgi:hypothetical protein